MAMPVDPDTMDRWEELANKANEVFQGQPVEDVGGALALLTAMLVCGMMQSEGPLTEDAFKSRVAWMVAQHGKLVYDMVPVFLELVEEHGGWAAMVRKGKH